MPNKEGGVGRVGGTLAMSRAIGDHRFKAAAGLPGDKQPITAVPDTIALQAQGEHKPEFMVGVLGRGQAGWEVAWERLFVAGCEPCTVAGATVSVTVSGTMPT